MYHRIADEKFDPWGIAVAPDKFAAQLSWLATSRKVIPLTDFADLHRRGELPDDAVAITFDDGYACTARVAAPLLRRHGVPATVFIPADMIGRSRPFWWDELSQIVMNHPGSGLRARGRSLDIGERQGPDAVWPRDPRQRTPRQKALYALWAELQPLPAREIETTLAELRSEAGPAAAEEALRLMTKDELRSLRSETIQFGSHALSHTSLLSLSAAEKAHEVRESVQACEELTGARPLSFAYPFGDFDTECEALVADAGFACACTVEPRAVAKNDDPFALPRLKVGNWTVARLRQELACASFDLERTAAQA